VGKGAEMLIFNYRLQKKLSHHYLFKEASCHKTHLKMVQNRSSAQHD